MEAEWKFRDSHNKLRAPKTVWYNLSHPSLRLGSQTYTHQHMCIRNHSRFNFLTIYTNGVYYMGIKAFNHLPSYIKELLDDPILKYFKKLCFIKLLLIIQGFLMVNFDVNDIICAFSWKICNHLY
jgi:hypothetical protein